MYFLPLQKKLMRRTTLINGLVTETDAEAWTTEPMESYVDNALLELRLHNARLMHFVVQNMAAEGGLGLCLCVAPPEVHLRIMMH